MKRDTPANNNNNNSSSGSSSTAATLYEKLPPLYQAYNMEFAYIKCIITLL